MGVCSEPLRYSASSAVSPGLAPDARRDKQRPVFVALFALESCSRCDISHCRSTDYHIIATPPLRDSVSRRRCFQVGAFLSTSRQTRPPMHRRNSVTTRSPPAGVQNGQANDLVVLIADDNVVVRQLAVRGDRGFLEVDVQHIRFRVVGGPEEAVRRLKHRWDELDVILYGRGGHI